MVIITKVFCFYNLYQNFQHTVPDATIIEIKDINHELTVNETHAFPFKFPSWGEWVWGGYDQIIFGVPSIEGHAQSRSVVNEKSRLSQENLRTGQCEEVKRGDIST